MVSSSLCFKSLIISTLRYWIHLKFIVIQLYFLFFSFSDSTHLLNNSSFHTGLKFTVHWIPPSIRVCFWDFCSVPWVCHSHSPETQLEGAFSLLALTCVSGHSSSSLLLWPFLHSPPAHGIPSCSVLVHFPFYLPSRSHPASWLKHQWYIEGIWLISLAQTSFLTWCGWLSLQSLLGGLICIPTEHF